MRVSGGGHFKQKSIKSKFVSISLRDKLIFLFVGTLFVELLLFGCVMSFYLYINAKKNVSDNIDTTVTAVSEVMDQSFLVMENLVLELAASNGVQNWLDDSRSLYDGKSASGRNRYGDHVRNPAFAHLFQRTPYEDASEAGG